MFRETIFENDDYTFDLSYEHGEVFVHLDVDNYNKTVYDHMVNTWLDAEEALRKEGFERVFAIPKKPGLAYKMGWEKITDAELNGKTYEVFLWPLL